MSPVDRAPWPAGSRSQAALWTGPTTTLAPWWHKLLPVRRWPVLPLPDPGDTQAAVAAGGWQQGLGQQVSPLRPQFAGCSFLQPGCILLLHVLRLLCAPTCF